jgi:hypothetical protein
MPRGGVSINSPWMPVCSSVPGPRMTKVEFWCMPQKSCHSLSNQYKYGAYPGPWEKYRHLAADAAVSTADSVTYYTDRVSPFSPETLAIKRRGKTAQIRVEKQTDHGGIHESTLSLIIRYRNSALRQVSSPPITVNSTVVFNISANGSVRMPSTAGRVKRNCDRLVAPSVSDPSWSGLQAENRTRKHNYSFKTPILCFESRRSVREV